VPAAACLIAASATLLALASALHSGPSLWHRLVEERRVASVLTPSERDGRGLLPDGVPEAAFAFASTLIGPGDRVFLQLPGGSGESERAFRTEFARAARFYLLPASVEPELAEATVVLSYASDPHQLAASFLTERRDPAVSTDVSRIAPP
jgi:hypothetical protein